MISHKKPTLFCIILLLSTFVVDGRRLEQRSYQQRHTLRYHRPLLRQVETGTVTGIADEDDSGTGTGTGTGMDTATGTAAEAEEEPHPEMDTKASEALIVLKPAQTGDSSRMFKGFLLKALLGGAGGGNNGGSGYSNIPYIIVNVPNNITNINQNSLNNTAAAEPTTTTTTPAPPGGRRQVFYQAVPFPEPTQVYEQRRSKPENQAHPQNFILSPSNQLVPVYLPPEVQALMQSSVVPYSDEQPNRGQLKKKKNHKLQTNVNPFSAFANNLRRIQFL
ncbi:uncharacterized protein LOC128922146 [Zeugodacus cucurbitae]|uniref:uncharacterized protein LOC128922146 n=1 Tax=Zeugodacus cucurbitae TaxID=28588 RepID=UPI0023D94E6B|nr:uncharacterized protein LOC128922146 [Zeugodacus cucurbitae]